jgi:hypothetical protein
MIAGCDCCVLHQKHTSLLFLRELSSQLETLWTSHSHIHVHAISTIIALSRHFNLLGSSTLSNRTAKLPAAKPQFPCFETLPRRDLPVVSGQVAVLERHIYTVSSVHCLREPPLDCRASLYMPLPQLLGSRWTNPSVSPNTFPGGCSLNNP